MKVITPKDYDPVLSVRETQEAIKYIRDTFQKEFGREMNLSRISAPLFVTKKSGLHRTFQGRDRSYYNSYRDDNRSYNCCHYN